MTSYTTQEAIEIIREAGFITRYKGYYIVIYRKVSEGKWQSFSKVRNAGGKVMAKSLLTALSS
jgi:nitrogen regulatory protein PII-like uncharacterized protein